MEWRWKNENKIFEIGKSFVIAPPWVETEKEKITFVAGDSFGTGVHETTVSCIELMENLQLKNKEVLDIGAGSGILSIAALKLGAKKAVGFDIEETAVKECIDNGRLNNVNNLECFKADSLKNVSGMFDLVFANIFFDIILSMSEDINSHTKANGYAILSGIVWEESYTVKSAFVKMGFKYIKTLYLKDYVTIILQKI